MSKEIIQLLKARHYQKNYTPPQDNVILSMYDIHNLGSLGNYIVFSGLPKAGKSLFINAVLASCMSLEPNIFGLRLEKKAIENHNVAYFDTESNEYDFYKNLDRIKSMGNLKSFHKNFNAYNTRKDGYKLNKEMITVYVQTMKPMVVIVDGLLDLIKNYNDESESRELVDWLKWITAEYNILLIGVIHLGKKDNHTLGHFGSMIDRYAQSVLEVEKNKEYSVYTLKPKYLRSSADFTPQSIQYNGQYYSVCSTPADYKPKK